MTCCLFFVIIKTPSQDIRLNYLNDTALIQNGTISEEPVLAISATIGLNKKADAFVKKYLKEYDRTLVVAKKRSESVFTIMDSVFTKFDLPVELKYMAVVESNLKTSVRSQAGASGIWQFMPLTAKTLGLKTTNKYDERLHVYKSTVAAARYMKQLYAEFGDWLLAVAAYNAGSGRVHQAIRHAGNRDFWQLQSFLPAETRNHIKRFIGVHYYFEGKGSLVTLTKAETLQHNKTMAEFMASNPVTNNTSKDIAGDPL